jgi:hypothetical protein
MAVGHFSVRQRATRRPCLPDKFAVVRLKEFSCSELPHKRDHVYAARETFARNCWIQTTARIGSWIYTSNDRPGQFV